MTNTCDISLDLFSSMRDPTAQPSPAQLAKGVGSTFPITVSLEDPKYDHSHPQSMKQRDETNKKPSRLDGIRVLLAEDMLDHQLLLKNMITLAGGTVDFAHDGEEAVTKVLAGDYDIILMDIKMPKLNGYEATHQLRAAGFFFFFASNSLKLFATGRIFAYFIPYSFAIFLDSKENLSGFFRCSLETSSRTRRTSFIIGS